LSGVKCYIARRGWAWLGEARHGKARQGILSCSLIFRIAGHGKAWQGTAGHGWAWLGKARQGIYSKERA